MPIIRTLTPTLSTLTDSTTAQAVGESVAFIGLACRTATARRKGLPLDLTKSECSFLREWIAAKTDPLANIRQAEVMLRLYDPRTIAVAVAGPRVDVPKIKTGQTGTDGRALAISVRKDMSEVDKEKAKSLRRDHASGAKALALLDTLSMVRIAWDAARASHVAFAAVTGEKVKAPGKRLESHAAALLTADPTAVGTLLKAMGLPETAIGAILALMASKATPAPAPVPAIAAPVGSECLPAIAAPVGSECLPTLAGWEDLPPLPLDACVRP